jgi:hypothetical protein
MFSLTSFQMDLCGHFDRGAQMVRHQASTARVVAATHPGWESLADFFDHQEAPFTS